jgi:redox-sensing transcriptional repressor
MAKSNNMQIKTRIPRAACRRLSFYLRELERLMRSGVHRISSSELGELLDCTSSQVRKDLAYFGQFGRPGRGYEAKDLAARIKKILGRDRTWNVALVGCGNLGNALAHYKGFRENGFYIAAAFDNSLRKIGGRLGHIQIHSMAELPEVAGKKRITLGVIAVPAAAAQKVADQLVGAGVRGLLNFAPTTLKTPRAIKVTGVDLALQMEQIVFDLTKRRDIS